MNTFYSSGVRHEIRTISTDPNAAEVRASGDELGAVGGRLVRRFIRSEPPRRGIDYFRGLLSDAERKNGWQLAEKVGDQSPDGVQHQLGRADWDADRVRDDPEIGCTSPLPFRDVSNPLNLERGLSGLLEANYATAPAEVGGSERDGRATGSSDQFDRAARCWRKTLRRRRGAE